MMEKPCKICTKVEKPEECINKFCTDWKRWFVWWWDRLRRHYEAQLQQMEGEDNAKEIV